MSGRETAPSKSSVPWAGAAGAARRSGSSSLAPRRPPHRVASGPRARAPPRGPAPGAARPAPRRGAARPRTRARPPGRPSSATCHRAGPDRDHLRVPLLRRRLVRAERLLEPLERRAQLELAEHLAQPRAVGLARDALVEVHVHLDLALGGGQLLGDARVLGVLASGSPCAWRRRCCRCWRARPRGRRTPGAAARRSSRRSRGRRGCCPRCRPSGPRSRAPARAGCRSGRAPPAVVDLRVRDAAAGGHHPHAVLDQLEEVAVAGHDHHVDALLVRLRARAWRSRRRPRSPRRARSCSRTRRRAGGSAATAPSAGRGARGARPCTPRRSRAGPTCPRPTPRAWASGRTR